jgi:tetratricopeptide (TPR) repeat protein
LACAHCEKGQLDEAEIAQKKAQKLGPSDYARLIYQSTPNSARTPRIVALAETGQHDQASPRFTELLNYTRNLDWLFFGRCWNKIPAVRDSYLSALVKYGLK